VEERSNSVRVTRNSIVRVVRSAGNIIEPDIRFGSTGLPQSPQTQQPPQNQQFPLQQPIQQPIQQPRKY